MSCRACTRSVMLLLLGVGLLVPSAAWALSRLRRPPAVGRRRTWRGGVAQALHRPPHPAARGHARRRQRAGQRQRNHDHDPRVGAAAQPDEVQRERRQLRRGKDRRDRTPRSPDRLDVGPHHPRDGSAATGPSPPCGRSITSAASRFAPWSSPACAGITRAAPASPTLTVTVYRPAIATQYGPGFYGQRTACGQTLHRNTLGVANRTLKCGTPVSILWHGRTIVVPVIDRGPYANHADWDLTEATGRALGISGTATIGAVSVPSGQPDFRLRPERIRAHRDPVQPARSGPAPGGAVPNAGTVHRRSE